MAIWQRIWAAIKWLGAASGIVAALWKCWCALFPPKPPAPKKKK